MQRLAQGAMRRFLPNCAGQAKGVVQWVAADNEAVRRHGETVPHWRPTKLAEDALNIVKRIECHPS